MEPNEYWETRYAEYLTEELEAQLLLEATEQRDLLNDPHALLHCPMGPNDANAHTIGEYLGKLLSALWKEGECFSGKRPLGNSDWQWDVYKAMVINGFADGYLVGDEDGYEEFDMDYDDQIEADNLILQAIKLAYDHG